MTVHATDPLIDRQAAADYLGVTKGTLEIWASTGRYELPYVKVGARAKYRRSELDKWIARRTNQGTAGRK